MYDNHDPTGEAAKRDHSVLALKSTPVWNGDCIAGKDQMGILKRLLLAHGIDLIIEDPIMNVYNTS